MNYREHIAGLGLNRHEKAYSSSKNLHCSSLEIADDETHNGIEYRISQVNGTWRRTEGILL